MSSLTTGMRFEMVYKKLRSTLEVVEGGYVVKAGSEFPSTTQAAFEKNHPASAAIRSSLVASGEIATVRPGVLRAMRDLPFDAPSTASSVLRGGPGERVHWKGPENKNLRTVADFEEGHLEVSLDTLIAIEKHF